MRIETELHATRDNVQSIEKAGRLLGLFRSDRPRLSLTELSRELGWNKPTTLRIANTLVKVGLLEREAFEGTVRFRLGIRILRMANIVMQALDVRQEALPFLRSLVAQTGESCYLMVRRGSSAVCIERVLGTHIVQAIPAGIGDDLPLIAGGAPTVILGFLPEPEQAAVLAELCVPSSDFDKWRTRLETIRAAGYSVSLEERHPDSAALGAPIFDNAGRIIAGISLCGPLSRFSDDKLTAMIPLLTDAARQISSRLGYRNP